MQTDQHTRESASLMGDFWGGLAAMLVALPSSIAFGVIVYTAMGPEYIGHGVMTGILGVVALGIVAPIFGRTGGLISAPCAPAAAVLSALVAEVVAGKGITGVEVARLPALMSLTILISAGLQIFYGTIGWGRLIKFIPYPVVSGYLSGVGILIAISQLPRLFGWPSGTPFFHGLFSPGLWKWQGLFVGLITMAVMRVAHRITNKVPGPVLGLTAGIISYFVLASFDPELMRLNGNSLILGPIHAAGSLFDEISGRVASMATINIASLKLVFIHAVTLSILLSIDTLKTCVVLDAMTRSRHNSDRELVGQGMGNLAAFMIGGMPGAGTMGPTLVNVTSGGRTPRSGIIEGVSAVLVLLLMSHMIAWVPIGALAGIMIVIAIRMFDRSMFLLLRSPAGRLDFAVIMAVILIAVTIDLIAASGVGVALAILLFIRDQIKGSVIRRKSYLNIVPSKIRRLASERSILKQHGDQGVVCELHGNLFFGTTDQLFSQLETDLRTKRFILVDMRRVQSMDYTAAHLFQQMQARLQERDGQLLFSGMPSGLYNPQDFESYLGQLDIIRAEGGVMVSETLNGALEWMEERILEGAGIRRNAEETPLALKEFELFRGLDSKTLDTLAICVRELTVSRDNKIFVQGDRGDELFLVRRGSVRILLPLEGGRRHHVADVGRGDFFGELAFLDRGVRSAEAEAKVATDLFVLSRAQFDTYVQSVDSVGVQVFSRLALVIAERLRQTDFELQALEDR
ncbi:MAG: SLC26A/SulP transporter family protein [Candidatus Riflebacteria bacterium]|nr:SLC26A/SulP transporter family protein [Candidatus Riflebacteria bacterium]